MFPANVGCIPMRYNVKFLPSDSVKKFTVAYHMLWRSYLYDTCRINEEVSISYTQEDNLCKSGFPAAFRVEI